MNEKELLEQVEAASIRDLSQRTKRIGNAVTSGLEDVVNEKPTTSLAVCAAAGFVAAAAAPSARRRPASGSLLGGTLKSLIRSAAAGYLIRKSGAKEPTEA